MKVGFIGLGAMGTPMAKNIAKQGWLKAVYNRSTEKCRFFEEQGIFVATSPAELALQVDFVVTMVTGPAALHDLVFAENGLMASMQAGQTLIQMSTISSAETELCHQSLSSLGVHMIDAPVSGTIGPAVEGKLVILAGGQQDDLDAAKGIFEALGNKTLRCGPVGTGTKTKLAVNLMLAGMMQSLSEALVFTAKSGVSADLLLDALEGGPLGAPLFSLKARNILQGRFEKAFPVDLVVKDLKLLLSEAEPLEVDLAQTTTNLTAYQKAQVQGYGDQDMSAVIKPLATEAKVSLKKP